REIKKHVSTPVAAVGGFTDPAMMEELIASGGADVVEFARQTLADPDFAIKARTGREDEINKCLRCMSCFASTGEGRHFHCAINPETGHELEYRAMPPVKEKKTVLVAGGGVGGMEAALTAAKRGHRVILCEKGPELGGVLRCEDKVPFKKHLKEYLERQAMLCARCGAEIRLNTAVTPQYVLAEKPDVLIAALGARPVMPEVDGIDSANVFTAEEIYSEPSKAGKRTVILGAGLVGLEMALFLTDLGTDVTVTEIAAFPNMGFGSMHTLAVNKELRARSIPIRLSTRAVKIRPDGVETEDNNGAGFLPADTVIVAAGMRALRDEAVALSGCAPEFIMLGDCKTPKNIIAATQPAHTAAMLIGTK
ncbi:MAG: FAD-dependent oxidoreductase, partial [Oscillospiraceae bacterium]|nr:FAD-dependent oxidoreductase [Oscillospiraceae bacterium]